jgi:transposase InsO family protein
VGDDLAHGIDPADVTVTLRHDNGTQFSADRYRADARALGITLSRTPYRHPDGNAFFERLYRTLKEECVWPNDFASFAEAHAAIAAWVIDYNRHRPHDSLSGAPPAPKPVNGPCINTFQQPDRQPPRGSLRTALRPLRRV